ncbi:hypothetical protein EQM13_15315 [Acidilutibacter cellobiosedens]|uniref:Uncharacterized protein n=1 Tax=Acidilutibacter cellobiosedens TaxID=2507161 RepID=A0A410QFY4_9FIRM|nr:hypothetical protein [Acidilutibacter cellobiosedens]QAT62839.1 hypothetical protein EQM13_15315 [Acidilutibacter cellobiosedens]
MNKKVFILSNVSPVIAGYGVFYILLAIIKQVPVVGQEVSKLWFIPFLILTAYIAYSTRKEYKLSKQNGL